MITIILAAFSMTAWRQVSYWKDSRTLFSHAAEVTDVNPVAHLVLANLEYNGGNLQAAFDEYTKANSPFQNARALDGMGNCVVNTNLGQAISYYNLAVQTNSRNALFHAHLAHALWLNKKFPDAKQEAQKAISLDSEDPAVRHELKDIFQH